jgi:bile acid:Na+ symporter, BASS family
MLDLIKLAILASVFLTVLGIGLVASWDDVTYLLRKPGLLARSFVSMFVIMPVICVCAALLTHLPPAIKVGLVALAISPVPPFVPKKQLMVGGRGCYVISLLSLAAVFSMVFVPVVASLFGAWFHHPAEVPVVKVAAIVCVTILIPLLLGVTLHTRMPALAAKAARPAGVVGLVLLVVCLVPLLIRLWPLISSFFGDGTVVTLAVIALVATAVGHFLGGPDAWNRKVLALSTSARHPGVAITVATSAYPDGKLALGAVLLYVLVVTLATVPYVLWSKRGGGESLSAATPRGSH